MDLTDVVACSIMFIVSWIMCGEIAFGFWQNYKIQNELKKSKHAKVDINYLFFEIIPYRVLFILAGAIGFIYVMFFMCFQKKEK